MPEDLLIIGGGEHARIVAEAARSRPEEWNVMGFVDPKPNADTARRFDLRRYSSDMEGMAQSSNRRFVLGIGQMGSTPLRRRLTALYNGKGARWAVIVHIGAWVSSTAILQEGVVVMAGAVVNSGARVGRHSIVNSGAIVEHDVDLGEFSTIAPGAITGGGTQIGAGSYLGLGCRIRDHIRVGANVTVGMGAVVIRDLPADSTVVGVPARAISLQ